MEKHKIRTDFCSVNAICKIIFIPINIATHCQELIVRTST